MPPRYFAGRAPQTPPSSDDEAPPTRPAPRKRARVVPRVVTVANSVNTLTDSKQPDVEPSKPQRSVWEKREEKQGIHKPTAEFVPVTELPKEQLEPSSESDSGSSESASSGSSGSYDQPEQEPVEELEEPQALPRPVFIGKRDREPAAKASEDDGKRKAIRRAEARRLVERVLLEEERAVDQKVEDLPDDCDREEDREKEFALWRVRELKRVMRDRAEEEEWKRKREGGVKEEEKGDGEKEEEAESVEVEEGVEKSKPGFMQKYYKMGAFFLERGDDGRFREEIYNRDYNKGTTEDMRVKERLPKCLQVRRGEFGRAGRSKHTHLAAEDTAREFAGELKRDKALKEALDRKGGAKDER